MNQPETLNAVAQFHQTFKHPILPSPTIPDENRCLLRVALIADVIVCDLTSAENANGEFLERLRHMHVRQGRRVPAVALVSRGLKDARGRAPGFQRYLSKPVDGDELRAAVVDLARE